MFWLRHIQYFSLASLASKFKSILEKSTKILRRSVRIENVKKKEKPHFFSKIQRWWNLPFRFFRFLEVLSPFWPDGGANMSSITRFIGVHPRGTFYSLAGICGDSGLKLSSRPTSRCSRLKGGRSAERDLDLRPWILILLCDGTKPPASSRYWLHTPTGSKIRKAAEALSNITSRCRLSADVSVLSQKETASKREFWFHIQCLQWAETETWQKVQNSPLRSQSTL